MNLKINSCGISDCAPSWRWTTAPGGFADYDLWAVFRGRGTLTPHTDAEPVAVSVREGACFLLAPDISYTAEHEPTQPLLVINVHFDFLDENGTILRPYRLPEAKSIAAVPFFRELLMRTVSLFNSNRHDAASTFLAAALEEFRTSDALSHAETDGAWTHIIHEICAEADSAKKPPTLTYFAEKYGYSERYIGKMFQKIAKISYSEYMLNSRISKAKNLLRLTDEPLAVIAEETGFYDACHFSRTFKRITGASPFKFRREGR